MAIAIMGIALTALFQLFSANLRTIQKAENYTMALVHARSMLDEAYGISDIEKASDSVDFKDGFSGRRSVAEIASTEHGEAKLYDITVTISWQPKGTLTIKGFRAVYTNE